jgi:hypothetical protein
LFHGQRRDMNASSLVTLLSHRELGSKIVRGEGRISKANAKARGERLGLAAEIFPRE